MMKTNNSVNRALILAAGLGSRLAPLTNDKPKALVQVNGIQIIQKQIDNLVKNGIFDITIVSGYKAEVLEEAVHNKWPEIGIKFVKSADYKKTNNMFSAYIGIRSMFPDEVFYPFYMMNADVFFDNRILTDMREDKRQNIIAVDVGRYIEESMKVIEQDGHLVAISKQIKPEDALGCSIDVYKFGTDGGKAFFLHCAEYIERRKELKHWSEVALQDALKDVRFYACNVNGRWYEIDCLEDLKEAEALFLDKVSPDSGSSETADTKTG